MCRLGTPARVTITLSPDQPGQVLEALPCGVQVLLNDNADGYRT